MTLRKTSMLARLPAAAVAAALAALAAAAAAPGGEPEDHVVRVDRVRTIALQRVGDALVAAGERGRILVSRDDGHGWTVAATPTLQTLTSLTFVDERLGFATGHQGTLLRTTDGARTWQAATVEMTEKNALFALAMLGDKGFAVGAYGTFLETVDRGQSWRQRHIGPADFDRHLTGIASCGADCLVIAGEAGTLLRSVDGGANWTLLPSPYEGSFFGIVGAGDGTLLAYGMRGHAYRSDDGGLAWQRVALGDYSGSIQAGVRLPDGTLVLAGDEGMVATSSNLGRSFALTRIPDRRGIAGVQRTGSGRWFTAGFSGLRQVQDAGLDGAGKLPRLEAR